MSAKESLPGTSEAMPNEPERTCPCCLRAVVGFSWDGICNDCLGPAWSVEGRSAWTHPEGFAG